MVKNDQYIKPTPGRPVFIAHCDDFGYLEDSIYKDWKIENNIGRTFALSYTEAITSLHKFIQSYQALRPCTKYEIFIFKGKIDKEGYSVKKKIYSISDKQAKEYKLKK